MFRLMGHSMSGVGVLDKAVTILAACVDGASLAELVERTKLPRATAHRLAQALEIHRMLVRDVQGRWRPGPRLGELANAAPDVLLTAAEPLLSALRDATGESAQLYLRRADERICVAAAERASGLRDTVPVGSVLPMVAGSAAQILLAWEPPEAVMPLLPRCKFTGRTLAEVRRRGWAQSVAEREPGVASVSAPIRDRTGRVIAAISVCPVCRCRRTVPASVRGATGNPPEGPDVSEASEPRVPWGTDLSVTPAGDPAHGHHRDEIVIGGPSHTIVMPVVVDQAAAGRRATFVAAGLAVLLVA